MPHSNAAALLTLAGVTASGSGSAAVVLSTAPAGCPAAGCSAHDRDPAQLVGFPPSHHGQHAVTGTDQSHQDRRLWKHQRFVRV